MSQFAPVLENREIALHWQLDKGRRKAVLEIDKVFFSLSEHLGVIAEQMISEPHASTDRLMTRFSISTGRSISAEELERAIKMLPEDLFEVKERKRDHPIRFQTQLLKPSVIDPIVAKLTWLYRREILISLSVLAVVAICACFVSLYGTVASKLTGSEAVLAFAILMIGVLFHELGHIAACYRFGIPHGGIGFGFYWGFPVFYADVRATWRLAPKQRAIVATGGIYFQSIFLAFLLTAYALTHSPILAAASLGTLFNILGTLNPILKYDGYWILSDLLSVDNLHTRLTRAFVWVFRGDASLGHHARPGRVELAGSLAFVALVGVCIVPVLWTLEKFSLLLWTKWKHLILATGSFSSLSFEQLKHGLLLFIGSLFVSMALLSVVLPIISLVKAMVTPVREVKP
jgi:hypothetical protein